MKIALISPSLQSLEALAAQLQQGHTGRRISRHEGGFSRLRSVAEQEQPDVIVVEGMCHDATELAPVEFVTTEHPHIFVIMLCTRQSPELLLQAMRAGVREVIPSPASPQALEAAMARAEVKTGLRKARRQARILAFIGAKGGSGTTFVATNLAHQLAARGSQVLLVDLNLQFGDAMLGLHDGKPACDIAQLARNLSRLDASFLQASVTSLAPGLAILPAPDDPAHSLEVKPEHLDAILNLAAGEYDFILIDLSRNLDELAIRALDRASRIYLVLQTQLPSVRNAARMMGVFRSLGYGRDKIEVLVNRHLKNDEIGLQQVRTALGTDLLRALPNAYRDASQAVNLGVPLAEHARSSPLAKALAELAEALAPAAEEAPSGLLRRLLSR